MPRFHTTVEDGVSEISSKERTVALPNHYTVRKVAGFIRSVRAKLSGHSSDTILPEPTTSHLRVPISPPGRTAFAPQDVNNISGIIAPTAGTGTEAYSDSPSACFRDPVLIPGCSPATYVYNHASATIQAPYEERFQEVVTLFQQNVKEHPQLADHRHNIDYVLRVCGTSPTNTCPSIVVFCRHSEFKDLRNLLTSRELKFQYCLRQPSRVYPWKETPGLDQDHRPFFNIYFWRQSRPRTLYCGNEPVRIHRRQNQTSDPMDNRSDPSSNLTLLGSVVELSGAERKFSTLGCVIRVGSEFYGITTMHTFEVLGSPDLTNADTATDNGSFCSDTPTAVIRDDVESPINDEKISYDADLCGATGEEYYYIDDVEYDDLSEDEYDDRDPTEGSLFATDEATLHPGVDSDYEDTTQNLRALFPTTPQLKDTHELDLDWAIINLTHTGNSHINAFFLPEAPSDPVLLSTIAESRPCQETPVFIITAGGTFRRGFLQPAISALGGVSGKVPSTLWTVVLNDQTQLTKGDSGSVVIDASCHTIYGHVVGCNPMGEIYVSPYASILRQIQHRFPGVVVTLAEPVSELRDSINTSFELNSITNDIGQLSPCSGATDRPALIPDGGLSSDSHIFDEALVSLLGNSVSTGKSNSGMGTSSAGDCELALLPQEVQRRCPGLPQAPVPLAGPQLFQGDSIPHAACPLLDGFPGFVRANLIPGVNGNGEIVSYISVSSLVNYWITRHSAHDLMFWEPPTLTIGNETHGEYLRIFSILVYIGRAASIVWFCSQGLDDRYLPLSDDILPADCPWADAFLSKQWKFCPLMLSKDGTYDRQLSPRTILPVVYEKQLTTGDVEPRPATTWKVWVSSEHNSKALGSERLVFKIFEGTSAYTSYAAEASIYAKLGDNTYDHITRSFGGFSFKATQKYIMVMEYAEWGSLLDLFQSTLSPKGVDSLYRLWSEMLSLLDALQLFHECLASEEGYYEFPTLSHCNIKPTDVLVFSSSDTGSRFDIKFKLSYPRLLYRRNDINCNPDIVNLSERSLTYSPPENCTTRTSQRCAIGDTEQYQIETRQTHGLINRTEKPITVQDIQRSDIWSLGAIYSEMLVWITSGSSGLGEYRLRRKEEINYRNPFIEPNLKMCFHDGRHRLSTVIKFHDLALHQKIDEDDLSASMSWVILSSMLTDAKERPSTTDIRQWVNENVQRKLDKRLNLSLGITAFSGNPLHTTGLERLETGLGYTRDLCPRPLSSSSGNLGWAIQQTYFSQLLDTWTLSTSPTTESLFPVRPLFQLSPFYQLQQSESIVPVVFPALEGITGPEEVVTVSTLYALITRRKRNIHFVKTLGAGRSKSAEIMQLPGMPEIRRRISQTGDRKFILIVDNSISMEKHLVEAKKTARVLSYMYKKANPNEVELCAASDAFAHRRNYKNSSQIEKAVGRMRAVNTRCHMRNCLEAILERLLNPDKIRPTTVFILTDGVWEPDGDQLEDLIRTSATKLTELGWRTSTIMTQFIQFGDDNAGTARLKRLEDKSRKSTIIENDHMVSVQHYEGQLLDLFKELPSERILSLEHLKG